MLLQWFFVARKVVDEIFAGENLPGKPEAVVMVMRERGRK